MLDWIAPFGIAEMIKALTMALPKSTRPVVFSILFVLYIILFLKLFLGLYCRLDYLIATTLRKYGFAPSIVQHWLGSLLERVPGKVTLAGVVFIVITLLHSLARYSLKPSEIGDFAALFQFWTVTLRFFGAPMSI